MIFVTVLMLVGGFASSIAKEKPEYDLEKAHNYFDEFITEHGKIYSSHADKEIRFNIFRENLKKYNHLNKISSSIFGINRFADLTSEEFSQKYTGLREAGGDEGIPTPCSIQLTDKDIVTKKAPTEHDWRDMKAVTEVKSQKECPSCYAFSTVGNIEGQYAIKHGQLIAFSEQECVDCLENSLGCTSGGYPQVAMCDIMKIGGLMTEEDYPYISANEKCKFDNQAVKAKVTECTGYNLTDDNKLKEVLYNVGPLSVGVAAHALQGYHGGILEDCNPSDPINHAVLLIGYGTENGNDFWLYKNSWGPQWGEMGYFRLPVGQNACNMMNPYTASVTVE